jgi:hypothetical protein
MSEDPEGEDLFYWIDWDDGTFEEWIGPYATGETITASHTWLAKDNYSLKAKAKNTLDMEGGYSSPYYVNIAASKVDCGMTTGGFLFAKVTIHNIGLADAYDVNWTLTLDGGWIFLGKQSSGTIDQIPANESVTVNSNLIVGIGDTTFTVTASEPFGSTDFRSQGGKLWGIYVHVNLGGG